MKNTIVLIVCSLLLKSLPAQPGDIHHFDWLCGTWQNISTGEFEQWSGGDDGVEWIGFGYTLSENDTVVIEQMTISKHNGKTYFIAEVPDNKAPAWFEISESTGNSFLCVNPQHDFPRFIRYTLNSSDSLEAVIGDDEKSFQFRFTKVKQD